MIRLIQIKKGNDRRVALVDEPRLRVLDGVRSIYELVNTAIADGVDLSRAVQQRAGSEFLDYDPIYDGRSEWRVLPPMDHPDEPARCMVSGTGLTHLGSAQGRQNMHAAAAADMHAAAAEQMTDSMKMFRWGIEGGRPVTGAIGTPPEWFYKGTGTTLRAHGEPL